MECGFDFTANEVDLFHWTDNDERVDSLIRVDVLRVYYAYEGKKTVDHVLALPASLIEVTNDIVPGSDSYMQIHSDGHPIDQSGIAYVINEDLSITYLCDLKAGMSLFGSYVPSSESGEDAPIFLSYLLSNNPRS